MLSRIELVAEAAFPVSDGHFFEMWLSADHRVVDGSRGRDNYHLSTMLFSGKRVAGLGRRADTDLNSPWALVGAPEAPPAEPVEIDPDHAFRIRLHVFTNVFPESELLASQLALRVSDGVRPPGGDFPLRRPDLTVVRSGDGQFTIDITPLLREARRI